jgi:hypothetical protein
VAIFVLGRFALHMCRSQRVIGKILTFGLKFLSPLKTVVIEIDGGEQEKVASLGRSVVEGACRLWVVTLGHYHYES